MVGIIVSWFVIAGLLLIVGVVLLVACAKARLSRAWRATLGIMGGLIIAAGIYWALFLYAFLSGL